MGIGGSKSGESQEDKDAAFVYDPQKIFWDEFGNLRYGKVHPVKQEKQIREIMQLDHVDDEETKIWYIMDSAWIASWLAFVHFDPQIAPAPGACRNDRLLSWNAEEGKYIGRFGLFMAVKTRAGDYRRVSKATWDKFCSMYPGSGPSITMELSKEQMNETGIYDTSKWTIVDPPPPPVVQKKKKHKKMFKGFNKHKDKNDKNKNEEGESKDAHEGDKHEYVPDSDDDDPDDDSKENSPKLGNRQQQQQSSSRLPPDATNDMDYSAIYKDKTMSMEKPVDKNSIRAAASSSSGSAEKNKGPTYAPLKSEKERGSVTETDGLIESDNTVRSSSVAAGQRRDSYIENVFFGKD